MKIRTIEILQDKLDEDLSWRKKELLQCKQIISSCEPHDTLFIRAGFALLCAHFEGFIRLAANYYVVYVSNKNVPYINIKNSLLALKFRGKFQECRKTEKASIHATLFDTLDQIQEKCFFVKYTDDNRIISTASSPSSKVFCEIMKSIGIDPSPFEFKKHYIDFSLLKNRHAIVHGEKTHLTKADFMETFGIIMAIVDEFKSIILQAAEGESYLKNRIGG